MKRAAVFALLTCFAGPVLAQSSPGGAPGATPAGRPAIDPLTARPGVTTPDAPLYDPVTGMPTQARIIARGRAGSVLGPPPGTANADPFGNQGIPGQPSRTGLPGTPPVADPFTAQPGVQQMRTGTYETYAPSPGAAQPGRPGVAGYPAQPGFPTQPGFPGQGGTGAPRPAGGYGAAGSPAPYTGGFPTGGAGARSPALDPYNGTPDDKYSYGRR